MLAIVQPKYNQLQDLYMSISVSYSQPIRIASRNQKSMRQEVHGFAMDNASGLPWAFWPMVLAVAGQGPWTPAGLDPCAVHMGSLTEA